MKTYMCLCGRERREEDLQYFCAKKDFFAFQLIELDRLSLF